MIVLQNIASIAAIVGAIVNVLLLVKLMRYRRDRDLRAAYLATRWRMPYLPDHYRPTEWHPYGERRRYGGHCYASTHIDNVCLACQGVIDPGKIEYSAPGHIHLPVCACKHVFGMVSWLDYRLGPERYQ